MISNLNLRMFPSELKDKIDKMVKARQKSGTPATQSSIAAELITEGLKKIKK